MGAPDARLRLAASFVREGAVFADIGTDHAYLPIYLLERGRIARAICADVVDGPLERARENLAAAGFLSRVRTVKTDGLCGLDREGLTDIAICGMGGELIARILADAPFVRDPAIRLILQPMSRAAVLRRYLAKNGFSVQREGLARAAGRVYACLSVSYDGILRKIDAVEAEIGHPPCGTEEERALFADLLDRKLASLRKKKAALLRGGHTDFPEEALLESLSKIREGIR